MDTICPAMVRRLAPAVVLFVFCFSATPAHATVSADFDGDGVVEQITVSGGDSPTLAISTSGSEVARVVEMIDRPIAVSAADVDHDGHPDISAVSKRHRLFIWLNRGHLGYSLLPQHHFPLRHTLSLLHRRHGPKPLASLHPPRIGGHDGQGVPAGQQNDPMPGGAEDIPLVTDLAPAVNSVSLSSERLSSIDAASAQTPRAPPAKAESSHLKDVGI